MGAAERNNLSPARGIQLLLFNAARRTHYMSGSPKHVDWNRTAAGCMQHLPCILTIFRLL